MTVTAVASADGPERPRPNAEHRAFLASLAEVATAQGVQPSTNPLAYLDGWIRVEDCVGPAFTVPSGVRAEEN